MMIAAATATATSAWTSHAETRHDTRVPLSTQKTGGAGTYAFDEVAVNGDRQPERAARALVTAVTQSRPPACQAPDASPAAGRRAAATAPAPTAAAGPARAARSAHG